VFSDGDGVSPYNDLSSPSNTGVATTANPTNTVQISGHTGKHTDKPHACMSSAIDHHVICRRFF